jgi:hypothetical protein
MAFSETVGIDGETLVLDHADTKPNHAIANKSA